MSVNVQELYQQMVLPLPEQERLELLALIARELAQARPTNGAPPPRGEKLSELFGAANLGHATGVDNEQIDADSASESASENPQPKRTPLGARERREAMDELLRYAGAVSSGNPHAADNEAIDADLAREYGKDL